MICNGEISICTIRIIKISGIKDLFYFFRSDSTSPSVGFPLALSVVEESNFSSIASEGVSPSMATSTSPTEERMSSSTTSLVFDGLEL